MAGHNAVPIKIGVPFVKKKERMDAEYTFKKVYFKRKLIFLVIKNQPNKPSVYL